MRLLLKDIVLQKSHCSCFLFIFSLIFLDKKHTVYVTKKADIVQNVLDQKFKINCRLERVYTFQKQIAKSEALI